MLPALATPVRRPVGALLKLSRYGESSSRRLPLANVGDLRGELCQRGAEFVEYAGLDGLAEDFGAAGPG